MRIFQKIALVGGMPLVILAAVTWHVLSPKIVLLQGSTRWDNSVQIIQACSDLIHLVQIERGSTAVFLKGGGSAKMDQARHNVDAQLGEYEKALAALPLPAPVRTELEAIPGEVAAMRRQAGGGGSSAEVFKGYTALIETMVGRIQKETQQKTDKGVGKRLLTLASLEQTKENAGRFRALLASTAAADAPLNSDQLVKLAAEKERASTGLESPILALEKENRTKLDQLLASPEWRATQARYATVLGQSQTGAFGIDSAQTFDDLTRVIDNLQDITQSQQDFVRGMTTRIHHQATVELTLWGLALLLALAGSVVLTVVVSRRITRPLHAAVALAEDIARGDTTGRLEAQGRDEVARMAKALNDMAEQLAGRARLAEQIANGDLTIEVKLASDDDLLGHALRRMVRTLRQLIVQAGMNSNQVATGAREIAAASQSLSQGSTEQAATLEEISASITEVSDHTRENAANAGRASELTRGVQGSATQGIEQMQALVKAMAQISTSSHQIGAIIKTVDDIAFQTNLLALNAAVEAARAGKHGKGFAVVAEEVRNLAGRSAKAAHETSQLIEDSFAKVKQGTDLATATAESFQSITGEVNSAAALVDEIAAAANDQAASIQEISEGLRQVDNVVQQSSASAEQLASASEMLFNQSQELVGQLASFQTGARQDDLELEEFSQQVADWTRDPVPV